MLQAVRRAHRGAFPRHVTGAVLAGLASRPASTTVASEDAKNARAIGRVATLVDPVTLFYEHPRKLLDAVKVFVDRGSARSSGELLTQLVANPVVENRSDAIRALFALPDVADNAVDRPLLEPSHADAIAKLATLPADTIFRARAFGLIVRARYEDAPFVSAENVISALPLGDPARFVISYVEAMPLQLHRLQLHWERDALAGRGTTADAARVAAAEQLLLVEQHMRERHPTLFTRAPVFGAFVRAFAAARAPEHAHRHRLELLKLIQLSGEGLDGSLSAARDAAELAAVWAETRPRVSVDAAPRVESILALHYARVGAPREARTDAPQWATLAREAESRGDDSAAPEPFTVLRANGLDWDGVAFMLGPYSPYRRLLARDRMLR